MQINAKVYYEKATGNVLVITSEVQGNIKKPTHDDMQIYDELKDKNINDIDFIELEFGTVATTFQHSKSYVVDLETKQLKVEYYTPKELQSIKDQANEIQSFNNRVSDISDYLKDQQSESISIFEDLIIQTELNKVMEGMN